MSNGNLERIKRSLPLGHSASPARNDRSPSDLHQFKRDPIRTWRSMRQVAWLAAASLALAAPLTCASTGAAAKGHAPAVGHVSAPPSVTAHPPTKGPFTSPPISFRGGPFAGPGSP